MLRGKQLKEAYQRGENIAAILRQHSNAGQNSEAIIEAAYDLQAGAYVSRMGLESVRSYKAVHAAAIAKVIRECGEPASLMEAGVGEATTMAAVLEALAIPGISAAGVDLCWSRLRWARHWLDRNNGSQVSLAMANLSRLPWQDGAFDMIYTSHSIEPNHGKEAEILSELYRITGRYLILLEPAYELGDDAARARMDEHGYCRDLPGHAERLGMKVIRHELFPVVARKENPTALTIIEKSTPLVPGNVAWACPDCHEPLLARSGFHYCTTCFYAFPVLAGIPCLRPEKAIVASQVLEPPLS